MLSDRQCFQFPNGFFQRLQKVVRSIPQHAHEGTASTEGPLATVVLSEGAEVVRDHKEDGIEEVALPRTIETSGLSQSLYKRTPLGSMSMYVLRHRSEGGMVLSSPSWQY